MAKSIGGTLFVRCMEAVRISGSPLWEVPLYTVYPKNFCGRNFCQAQLSLYCSNFQGINIFTSAVKVAISVMQFLTWEKIKKILLVKICYTVWCQEYCIKSVYIYYKFNLEIETFHMCSTFIS